MIPALCTLTGLAAGFFVARFVYRNTPEERAAFDEAWKKAPK